MRLAASLIRSVKLFSSQMSDVKDSTLHLIFCSFSFIWLHAGRRRFSRRPTPSQFSSWSCFCPTTESWRSDTDGASRRRRFTSVQNRKKLFSFATAGKRLFYFVTERKNTDLLHDNQVSVVTMSIWVLDLLQTSVLFRWRWRSFWTFWSFVLHQKLTLSLKLKWTAASLRLFTVKESNTCWGKSIKDFIFVVVNTRLSMSHQKTVFMLLDYR